MYQYLERHRVGDEVYLKTARGVDPDPFMIHKVLGEGQYELSRDGKCDHEIYQQEVDLRQSSNVYQKHNIVLPRPKAKSGGSAQGKVKMDGTYLPPQKLQEAIDNADGAQETVPTAPSADDYDLRPIPDAASMRSIRNEAYEAFKVVFGIADGVRPGMATPSSPPLSTTGGQRLSSEEKLVEGDDKDSDDELAVFVGSSSIRSLSSDRIIKLRGVVKEQEQTLATTTEKSTEVDDAHLVPPRISEGKVLEEVSAESDRRTCQQSLKKSDVWSPQTVASMLGFG